MLERDKPPSLAQVTGILEALISGGLARSDVAEWASYWVSLKNPPIHEGKVWSAIQELTGADMITTDRPFLYGVEDFRDWLNKLQAQ
jgi:hypothetical protein